MLKLIRGAIRRVAFEAWLSVVALALAGVMLTRPHRFFFKHPSPIAFDDGYTVALAERIIDHRWLPYVTGCSHRGPLLYWSVAVFQVVFGRFSWLGVRWWSIFAMFSVLVTLIVAGFAARRPVAGAIAVFIQVWLTNVYEVGAAWGINGETAAAPLTMFALAFTTIGLTRLDGLRARSVLLFLGGVCAALAGLAKQTALPAIGPLAIWTAMTALAERQDTKPKRYWLLLALAGGFLGPILLVVLRYGVNGQLAAFWYWYYRYNAEIYMEPHRHDDLRTQFDPLFAHRDFAMLGLAVITITTLLARVAALGPRPWRFAKAYVSGGFEITLTLLTLVLLLGALAPLRFFLQYFVTLFPLVALLIGIGIERALSQARGSPLSFGMASALAVASMSLVALYANDYFMRHLKDSRANGAWASVYPEPICEYLDDHSPPASPIFIWGFDGDLYVTCHRKPASRFVYLTLVAGIVPDRMWHLPQPKYVAPGSREQLLADLKDSRPDVVLDMPYNMKGVSLKIVPELVQYLENNYCKQPGIKAKNGRDATPWIRKRNDHCD